MRVRPSTLALLLLALVSGCRGSVGEESGGEFPAVPRLQIEGTSVAPEHAHRIEQIDPRRLAIAMQLLGLADAGEPILLVLAPEDSLAARSAPSWIAGYAISDRGVAILFPDRTPIYPDSSFEELVLHEVGHVLVYRATGGTDVPRWFHEGLALFIGRPWRLEDHSRVTWALVSGREVSLSDLEPYFNRSRESAGHAYALAGAFVQDLVNHEGPTVVAEILAAVRRGASFPDAYLAITGETLVAAERKFWSRHTLLYRWVPVLGSSATLWLLITLLSLVAFKRRRDRDRALIQRWELQESSVTNEEDAEPR